MLKTGEKDTENANIKRGNEKKSQEKNVQKMPEEINGPRGLEPTRYGDWEANGRCYDF